MAPPFENRASSNHNNTNARRYDRSDRRLPPCKGNV